MKHLRFLLLTPFALLFFTLGQAQALVGVEVKLWQPEVDAKVQGSTDAIDGTDIDLEDDLDLDSADDIPYIKVWLGGSHRIVGTYTKIELSGKQVPDIAIAFEGETFAVGVEVDTDMELKIYRLAWESDWINIPGTVRLGTILGTDVLDVKISLDNDLIGSEEVDAKVPIPIIGLQGELTLYKGFGVYGEIAGLHIDQGDFEGSFFEYEAGLKYTMANSFSAMAGWRELDLNVEDDEDEVDFSLGGFIVGVGFQF